MDLGRFPTFTQTIFQAGRALLLLDGFDELTPDGQKTVSDYLKILIQTYPKTQIVTTTTPDYIDGLMLLGFAPLGLMAWNTQYKDKFIESWSNLWSSSVAFEQNVSEQIDPILLNAWLSLDNTQLTPFELTLKAWGAYAGDLLGPRMIENIAAHIRRLSPQNVPIAALEAVAIQVILNTQPVFDPGKAREWVKSFDIEEKETPEGTVDAAAGEAGTEESKTAKKKGDKSAAPSAGFGLITKLINSGLLSVHEGNRVRFAHPIFGGYLAGRALSGYDADEKILNQPDWVGKHLALNYMAVYGDPGAIVGKMLEWSRLPTHRPLLTTARWLRESPRNAAWRGQVMGSLVKLMQTESIPLALRAQAMSAFVASNDPSAATLFRQLMTSMSFELIQLCALGSGALRDTKAVPTLSNLLDASSISARRAACMALVSIGTTEALEIVAHALLNGDDDLRRAAAEALANDRTEGWPMLQDGASMNDILVRRAVAYGLARVPAQWAKDILVSMQTDDDQWIVRNLATEIVAGLNAPNARVPRKLPAPSESPWLIEFAGKQGMGVSPGTPATDILLLALKAGDPDVRLAALPYLKSTPNEGVIGSLYDAMLRDDPELRDNAYNVLWEIGLSGVKLPNPAQFGLG
jgi:HEAT repeat protein